MPPIPRSLRRHQRAYTALELLTSVSILAIAAALAVPSILSLRESSALTGRANELLAQLQSARQWAVQLQRPVLVLPAGDWDQGAIAVVDQNGNQQADPDERRLRATGPVDTAIRTLAPDLGANSGLRFRMDGSYAGNVTINLLLCSNRYTLDGDETQSRRVRLSPSGRAEVLAGSGAYAGLCQS